MFLKKLFATIFLSNILCLIFAQQKKFTRIPSSASGITFNNTITEDPNMFYYIYEYLYLGAGVSVGDINNDGLQDIYFNSTRGDNKLYLNQGNFKFTDITNTAGVAAPLGIKTGVNMVDVNNDGYLDILICKSGYKDPNYRKKQLFINNKNLTFTDKAAEYGLDDASYSIQSYFFDYDNDGDKDVYFVNHPIDFSKSMHIPATMLNGKLVYVQDTNTLYVSDRLYENKGNKFVDVTKKAGLINHAFGLSASIFDFNNDNYPDIFLANDFNKPDAIYINNKNGTFTDKLTQYLNKVSFSSMGSDINDINNDGHEDMMVVDMAVEDPVRQKQLFAVNQGYDKFNLLLKFNLFFQYPHNMLQLNNGNGTFSQIAYHAGVAETEWSWAPLIADFDNDGWKDMYVANGLKKDMTDWDYKVFILDSIMNLMNKGQSVDLNKWLSSIPEVKVKNYLYKNNGSLKFENFTDVWMDEPPSFSSGTAYADLDNDGDLDLIVNNVDDEAFIFKNNQEQSLVSNFLRCKFYKNKSLLQEVYGAKIKLTFDDGTIQVQHYDPQRGFLSTVEHAVHFGLGVNKSIAKVEVEFASGKKLVQHNVAANQTITFYEDDALPSNNKNEIVKPIFTEIKTPSKFNYTHTENDYVDFKREPLIPYKCSRKGPYFTKADVNGDKVEDIFIGGSAGTSGKLFLQTSNGTFIENKQVVFEKDKMLEDNGVLFFDADNDGDNDLYVTSGGAEFDNGSAKYQDRLYINNGKGIFTKAVNALPTESYNGTCVIPLDFDSDGDLDLFVGGGVTPGKFPLADGSMLLQNNKGVFTNVTATIASELSTVGIINAASWANVDAEKNNELIVTGEWMPTTIFKYQQGKFIKQQPQVAINIHTKIHQVDTTINLDAITGWWNTTTASDIDNDGDMDLIVGNRGTNSKIQCNFYEPTTIYAKDFDGNGSYDAVLGYSIWGKCYPMYSRDFLIDQMPMFRKKYTRYRMYSGQTMDDIFTTEQKKGMQIFKANCFESGVLINNGNYNFTFIPLPERAQLSTINDVVIDDFDKDGITDIVVCGNNYDADVSTGNYDATAALLLKGISNGKFTAVDYTSAGLNIKGEVRKMIYLKEKKQIIFLKNNGVAQTVSF
ncbi:MAG: VCBS repeat-containing protein [Ferruginibacter sp.]|nr:VCBS repeat-containing protein [Ferruginibacter sp.]